MGEQEMNGGEDLHQEDPQPEGLHQEGLHQEGPQQEGPRQGGLQMEGLHQQPRKRSSCWRFLNWLSEDKQKVRTQKRTTRTYVKEATDEHLISSSESFRIILANCEIKHIS